MARVMTDFIEKSVGSGGANQRHDVVRIQAFLNAMPPAVGGPTQRLKQDGIVGPKTLAAIQGFQRFNFGEVDGRVDPGKRMEKKLIELERTPAARPLDQIGPALSQARVWMGIAYPAVVAHIDTSGRFTDRGPLSASFKELFRVGFGHPLSEDRDVRNQMTPRQLSTFRTVFDRAARIISAEPIVHEIKTLNTLDGLQEPNVHSNPPLLPLSTKLLVTYRLTDWDAVSGYGMGPMTRAGLLLQTAFQGGIDDGVIVLTADQSFIESGLAEASLTLLESGRFSWFAQRLAQGPAFRFFHVPRKGTTWQDVPDLP